MRLQIGRISKKNNNISFNIIFNYQVECIVPGVCNCLHYDFVFSSKWDSRLISVIQEEFNGIAAYAQIEFATQYWISVANNSKLST